MSQTPALPVPLTPRPGVLKTESLLVASGRWSDSDKVRMIPGTDGLSRPEKVGGWEKQTSVLSIGAIRALGTWRDLSGTPYVAAGTYAKLYLYDANFLQNDITPIRASGTLPNNPFTTTLGSPLVKVTHAANGVSAGDFVNFSGSAAVGGVTPNGEFSVVSVADSADYFINVGTPATSAASGGGNSVAYVYEIPAGVEATTFGTGAGVGPWGLGTWGTPRSGSTLATVLRVWSLDHFGKLLIASYNGGTVYQFDPTAPQPYGPATAVSFDAPTDCRWVFVTNERFVVALRDNMVLAWCSQGDFTTWTPATNNTATTRTLQEGNQLVGGRSLGPFVSIIWSDAAAFLMQYTGDAFVHDTRLIGKDCGLLAPQASISVGGVAYWMGSDTFWMYDGTVRPMPNVMDIRDFVFNNLTTVQGYQCFAVFHPRHNEIWFHYTVGSDVVPSRYVIYNLVDQSWMVGSFTRTAGTHFTQGATNPYYADVDGNIYEHEVGFDNNGAGMTWTLTFAPTSLSEGQYNVDVEGIQFDDFDQIGNVSLELVTYDRVTDTSTEDSETETIPALLAGLTDLRLSGRYIGFTITSSDVGGYFKMGHPTVFTKRVGRRR